MCIVFSRQKSEESSKDCYVLIMKQSKIQINQAQWVHLDSLVEWNLKYILWDTFCFWLPVEFLGESFFISWWIFLDFSVKF